ncbi:hypothetical protein H5P28_03850 [Ruficoccus amylovorans]|uniref:Lipoprotein n=1 Tax=Ruficoccus amylovorans TaxID=1804625 RepID=A0A842HCQ6_9BACT|nr:hypothetical protein [Ruficoccus amylovorans]MBC2593387.1 hypothetical protein [Ruficoccus amylovorans]
MKITLSLLSLAGLFLFAGCQNTPQTEARAREMDRATEAYQQSLNEGAGNINAPADENPLGVQNEAGDY